MHKKSVEMINDVRQEMIGDRQYRTSNFFEELGEIFEELKNRNWSEASMELSDSAYQTNMLLHKLTKLNFPMIGGKRALEKFRTRNKVIADLLSEHGVDFNTDYLIGGSNFAKPHKLKTIFRLAGIDLTDEQARVLSERGVNMAKESQVMPPQEPKPQNDLQQLLRSYMEQYRLATGDNMTPTPRGVPQNTYKMPRRGISPANSTPSMQLQPQPRPDLSQKKSSMAKKLSKYASVVADHPDEGKLSVEKEAGWVLPFALGGGTAAAYLKRRELAMLLKRMGIGKDPAEDYIRQSRYLDPRVAQATQRALAGNA